MRVDSTQALRPERLRQELLAAMRSLEPVTIGIYEKALPSAMTWPERLAAARQTGFDFVEMSIDESDLRLQRLDWRPRQRDELRATIAATGVPITSMCLSGQRKYPMGSKSERTRHESLQVMQKAIGLAYDLAVRVVLVPGYDVFYEPSDDETRAHFLDGLRQALAWASQAKVILALENTEQSVTSITEAVGYVRALDSPWLRLYGDVGNLQALGYNVLAELEAGAGYLAGIHVKDTVAGEFRHVPFGQGSVPFVPVFRKLWEIGFRGPITLEMWGGDDGDALQTIAEARRWVQAHIEASRRVSAAPAPGQREPAARVVPRARRGRRRGI